MDRTCVSWVLTTKASKEKSPLKSLSKSLPALKVLSVPQLFIYPKPWLCSYCYITKSYTCETSPDFSFGAVPPTNENVFLVAIFKKINFQLEIRDFLLSSNKPIRRTYDIDVNESPYKIQIYDIIRNDLTSVMEVHFTQTFLHNEWGRQIPYSQRVVKLGLEFKR
jgi:hypothetical protein